MGPSRTSQISAPLSNSILNGISCECEKRGLSVYNIAFRLQFNCYLRANGKLNLSVRDIALLGDTLLRHWGLPSLAGLRLVDTKTGPNPFVRISDRFVLQLLPSYLRARVSEVGRTGALFPWTYETLHKIFHRALQ